MRKSFKYRVYPSKKQAKALSKAIDACRWVYNKTIETRKDAYEKDGKSLSLYDTNKLLTTWKVENPSLSDAHSQCLQNAQLRVDLGFKAFFRRVKAGQKPGYPRFRGFDCYDSITFPQVPSGCVIQDSNLIVSKVGKIKIAFHRPIEGRPKTCTIMRTNSKWFASFSCENVEAHILEPLDNAVGIDVGLTSFATLSTGDKIANPRFFRVEEKALAKSQRKLSALPKGGLPRSKAKKVVARIHERISNRRHDFAHQEAHKIVNRFGIICVEDLNITRMVKNHCLAKSISDASWSKFFDCLAAKAVEAARKFIKINPNGTSQRCSRCQTVVKKDLSIRVHDCPVCGLSIDRDLNAAYNIVSLGLQAADSRPRSPGIYTGE